MSSRTGCSLDYGLKCASGGRWWVSGRDAALIVALCEPLAVGGAVGRDAALIVALCEPLAVGCR